MAIDLVLLILIVVVTAMLLVANVYILVYFQHEDDKNTAYFPKFLVIFGLLFAEATVLLLPLDVANNSSAIGCKEGWNTACGNINMNLLWLLVFIAIILVVIVLLPFSIYYYEADDGEDDSFAHRMVEALKLETATVAFAGIIIAILFITVSKSNIPIRAVTVNALSAKHGLHTFTDGASISSAEVTNAATLIPEKIRIAIKVSFPIYVTGIVSFAGSFAFTIFCGIGLVALPLDLILSYFFRPKFISADVYARQKLCLQRRSHELLELGRTIKQSMDMPGRSGVERRKQKKTNFIVINKFKQAVYLLEQDMEELKLCHDEYKNYNPLVALGKFVLGIISALVTVMWVMHMLLYMLPPNPILPFLNSYFMWFDQWFPLFGTISVGVFSSYLLACTVKGCFKFGMRCFCFALHPMKLHGTYMNSMMFNLALILACAIPAVQFSDEAFRDYGRLTAIRSMMGVQIHYLQGITFFWEYHVFVYGILAFCFLSCVYLLIKPRDRAGPVDGIRKKIEKQVAESASGSAV